MTDKTLGGRPIKNSSEIESKFRCLLYGASGAGKTTLAASAAEVPELYPVLFLDIEDGQESVKNLYDVDSIRTTDMHQIQKIYGDLRKGGHGYNTLVVDNITELQQHGMADIMGETEEWEDPDVPQWGTYHKSTEQMRRFIRAFRDLDLNVIFTAHVTTEENERTKKERYRPYLTKKPSEQVPGFLNQVLFMYLQGKESRIVQTVSTDSVVAKDRSRKLPPSLNNPTMKVIWGYMSGELDKEDKENA